MKKILVIISFICLALTVVPAFLVFSSQITLGVNKNLMFFGTVGWFLTSPFWMKQK